MAWILQSRFRYWTGHRASPGSSHIRRRRLEMDILDNFDAHWHDSDDRLNEPSLPCPAPAATRWPPRATARSGLRWLCPSCRNIQHDLYRDRDG
jgi:hypothetical protein